MFFTHSNRHHKTKKSKKLGDMKLNKSIRIFPLDVFSEFSVFSSSPSTQPQQRCSVDMPSTFISEFLSCHWFVETRRVLKRVFHLLVSGVGELSRGGAWSPIERFSLRLLGRAGGADAASGFTLTPRSQASSLTRFFFFFRSLWWYVEAGWPALLCLHSRWSYYERSALDFQFVLRLRLHFGLKSTWLPV